MKKHIFTQEEIKKIWDFYLDFRNDPALNQLYSTPQHRTSNTFRHVNLVTQQCLYHCFKKGLEVDFESLIVGAMLHDLFFYDWRKDKSKKRKHLWRHPQVAYENATKLYDINEKEINILCGHYEGVDERVRETLVDREISIGDYILTSGNLPAMVMTDAVVRLLPGALGDDASSDDESFESGLLEYPQYTRPPEFNGLRVPEVLLSGDHEKIAKWRKAESLRLTLAHRPDLIK